jgi:hypothetical protein
MLLQTPAVERIPAGGPMRDDHPGMMPGRRVSQAVAAAPGEECPAWCDGEHEVDDLDVACHVRIVAQRDRSSVTLSCVRYRNPAETGGVRIIMATDVADRPVELAESDAIRMVGVLESAAGGVSWLSAALRSALDLLDPGVGWISRNGTGVRAGSHGENGA